MKKYGSCGLRSLYHLAHTYKSWNLCVRCCWSAQPISLRHRLSSTWLQKKGLSRKIDPTII